MQTFRISGIVRHGKHLGNTMGFPTANLAIPSDVHLPENGVYVGIATLQNGQEWPCVLNQGKHPTLPEGDASIEAHLLGFSGDLYGQKISIEYLEKLRPELHFSSIDALIEQVNKDRNSAKSWFTKGTKREPLLHSRQ